MRQKAVVCACALATAAPTAMNCNSSTNEAARLFGQTIASHAERLLLAKDHLQNKVHTLPDSPLALYKSIWGTFALPPATGKTDGFQSLPCKWLEFTRCPCESNVELQGSLPVNSNFRTQE